MPFVSKDEIQATNQELDEMRTKLDALEGLEHAAEQAGIEPTDASHFLLIAADVHRAVLNAPSTPDWNGDVVERARAKVQNGMIADELNNRANTVAVDLKHTILDELEENRDEIRKGVKGFFVASGEAAALEEQLRSANREAVLADVRTEATTEINARLADEEPATREEIKASDEFTTWRAEQEAYARDQQRDNLWGQARQEGEADIEAQLAAETPTVIAQLKAEYLAQPHTRDYIERKRRELRNDLSSQSNSEVLAEAESEDAAQIKAEITALALTAEARRVRAETLIDTMTHEGMDLTAAQEGDKMTLEIGEIVKSKSVRNLTDRNGYNSESNVEFEVTTAIDERVLTLTSLGGNEWIVDNDSLGDSTDPYRRNDAIEQGTVIGLGRSLKAKDGERFQERLCFGFDLVIVPPSDQRTNAMLGVTGVTYNDIQIHDPRIGEKRLTPPKK